MFVKKNYYTNMKFENPYKSLTSASKKNNNTNNVIFVKKSFSIIEFIE